MMTSTFREDPFDTLPAELCLPILLALESKTTISALTRASPWMLQVYLGHKAYVNWHLLASDFDGDMMQDAVFIILLPRSEGPVYSQDHYGPYKAILELWRARKLPDPVASRDTTSKLFWSLDKLHSVLVRLVEDYVTKATSDYIVQSFPCLPQMGPSQRFLTFRGKEIMTRLDACVLRQYERSHLLKYFLYYEWVAKTTRGQLCFASMNSGGWTPRRRRFQNTRALISVNSYVASLYQAIISQITDESLPQPGEDFCPQTGILYPPFASKSPAIYSAYTPYDFRVIDLPEALAVWGLDLLLAYLSLDVSLADHKRLIEDNLDTQVTPDGTSHGWLSAQHAIEQGLERQADFATINVFHCEQPWQTHHLLGILRLHKPKKALWPFLNQWRCRDESRFHEQSSCKRSFDIEGALRRNREERDGNPLGEGINPLPQLILSDVGFAVVDQSQAFWRLGLRAL